ncbi:DUF2461 domain-containing protein [Marinilabiliaceae bacterium JC017]|nr:DUF2461 domain-containing protein [Marinilabiliaceae bacterium JC017]
MIASVIPEFLTQLAANNNREWFAENKPLYQTAKNAFEATVAQFIALVQETDKTVGQPAPKDCIFRLFRDTRFSKDKTPYKTNFGAYVAKGGRKSQYAGYYLHIDPGQSFFGGGIYCPQPAVLKTLRREIYNFPEEFKDILEDAPFKQAYGEMYADKLKMAPKGFPKDFEFIDLLKYKSYTVIHELEPSILQSPELEDYIRDQIKLLYPFNDFLNRAIDHQEDEFEL